MILSNFGSDNVGLLLYEFRKCFDMVEYQFRSDFNSHGILVWDFKFGKCYISINGKNTIEEIINSLAEEQSHLEVYKAILDSVCEFKEWSIVKLKKYSEYQDKIYLWLWPILEVKS